MVASAVLPLRSGARQRPAWWPWWRSGRLGILLLVAAGFTMADRSPAEAFGLTGSSFGLGASPDTGWSGALPPLGPEEALSASASGPAVRSLPLVDSPVNPRDVTVSQSPPVPVGDPGQQDDRIRFSHEFMRQYPLLFPEAAESRPAWGDLGSPLSSAPQSPPGVAPAPGGTTPGVPPDSWPLTEEGAPPGTGVTSDPTRPPAGVAGEPVDFGSLPLHERLWMGVTQPQASHIGLTVASNLYDAPANASRLSKYSNLPRGHRLRGYDGALRYTVPGSFTRGVLEQSLGRTSFSDDPLTDFGISMGAYAVLAGGAEGVGWQLDQVTDRDGVPAWLRGRRNTHGGYQSRVLGELMIGTGLFHSKKLTKPWVREQGLLPSPVDLDGDGSPDLGASGQELFATPADYWANVLFDANALAGSNVALQGGAQLWDEYFRIPALPPGTHLPTERDLRHQILGRHLDADEVADLTGWNQTAWQQMRQNWGLAGGRRALSTPHGRNALLRGAKASLGNLDWRLLGKTTLWSYVPSLTMYLGTEAVFGGHEAPEMLDTGGLGVDPVAMSDEATITPQGALGLEVHWPSVGERAAAGAGTGAGWSALTPTWPALLLNAGIGGTFGALDGLGRRQLFFSPRQDRDGVMTAADLPTTDDPRPSRVDLPFGGLLGGVDALPGAYPYLGDLWFTSYTAQEQRDHEFARGVLEIRTRQLAERERAVAALATPHRVGLDPGVHETAQLHTDLAALRAQAPVSTLAREVETNRTRRQQALAEPPQGRARAAVDDRYVTTDGRPAWRLAAGPLPLLVRDGRVVLDNSGSPEFVTGPFLLDIEARSAVAADELPGVATVRGAR